ncbi:MAG: branched-chain amino acid ABC transporter permease [Ferrimicrobium sp.]
MLFEYAVVAGILLGIFYAWLAMGLNLIFGVQRIINLAHGDVVMLGGFATWELYYTYHVNPILSVIVVMPFAIGLGFVLHRAVVPRLSSSSDAEMLSLVLFFGVSQVLEAIASSGFGSNQRTMPATSIPSQPFHFLGQVYPAFWWLAAAIGVPVLTVFFLYLYRSSAGRQARAVMADADEAMTVGINAPRVSGLFFGVGIALAASAGAMAIFIYGGVDPTEGVAITITAFAIIVFGSLGNPFGTVVGGILFGVAFQLAQVYAPTWSGLVPYVLVLGTMLLRPQGILGKGARVA